MYKQLKIKTKKRKLNKNKHTINIFFTKKHKNVQADHKSFFLCNCMCLYFICLCVRLCFSMFHYVCVPSFIFVFLFILFDCICCYFVLCVSYFILFKENKTTKCCVVYVYLYSYFICF